MRKRIVGLLLLVAMLITAIPVMVAAEEVPTAEKAEAPVYVDLHTLYVQDGLQNLFTVFGKKNGVDMEAGTWTAMVGDGVATFGNKGYWSKNEHNGSVGYDMYFGTYIDGNYVESTKSAKLGSNYFDYGTQLSFDIALLPAGDFTLEYFAEHKPYYVTDGVGNLVLDEDGKPYETYNVATDHKMPQSDPGNTPYNAVIRVGYLQGFTYNYDGAWNNSGKRFSGTQWKISGTYVWSHANSAGANYINGWDFFLMNEGVRTYAITRDVKSATAATYEMIKDAKLFTTTNFDAEKVTANVNGYGAPDFSVAEKDALPVSGIGYSKDAEGNHTIPYDWTVAPPKMFWLAERHGTDFYGVRIYDRVLSEDERIRNRAVDVMLAYGVELKREYANNLPAMQMAYEKLAGEKISTNALENTAKKLEIEAMIEECAAYLDALDMSDTLYVTEGLTSLFTAFESDAPLLVKKDGNNHIWHNRVSGQANATFLGNLWEIGDVGGVGKYYIRGTWDGTTLTESNPNNTPIDKDYSLNLGLALLPDDDYTVEYLAYFPMLYAEVYEDGVKTEELHTHYTAAYTESYYLVDCLGWLQLTSVYPGGWLENSMRNWLRGIIAQAECKTWPSGDEIRAKYGQGSSAFGVGTRNTLTVDTYGFMRDETLVYADDGVTPIEQTAAYTFTHNAEVAPKGTASFTTKGGLVAEGGTVTTGQYFYGEDDGGFWLSKNTGATFYALRVYDRVLTVSEQRRNHLADVLYYYGIELTDAQKANEMLLNALQLYAIDISGNSLAYAAKRQELLVNIETLTKATEEKSVENYAATEHLTALYTTFIPGTVDLKNGGWYDLVGGARATFVTSSRWFENGDGSVGFNVLKGSIDADGVYNNSYSQTGTDIRLEFGLAQLPEASFTVDYVANYKPLYVRDGTITSSVVIATDENGTPLETYDYNIRSTGNYLYQPPIDRLGWFSSISQSLDGNGISSWIGTNADDEQLRGHVCWAFMWQTWGASTWNGGWVGTLGNVVITGLAIKGDAYHTHDAVRSYAVAVDEKVTGEGASRVTTGELLLYRDAVLFNSSTKGGRVNSTANGTTTDKIGSDPYHDVDVPYSQYPSNTGFWLSNRRPTDFYVVRIYDKALTLDELAQNHAVDIVYYYGLSVPEEMWELDSFVEMLSNAFLNQKIVYGTAEDADVVNALQNEINALIDACVTTDKNDYASLYVTNGTAAKLKGLYTAFAGDYSANLRTGVWQNKVEGEGDATIRDYAADPYWERRTLGIGYTMTYLEWEDNGSGALARSKNVGISLPAEWENLDNFTVETFATVVGVTDENGDRYVATGEKFVNGNSAFRFGILQSLFFGGINYNASTGSFGGASLALRWNIWQVGWDGSSPGDSEGKTVISTDTGWRRASGANTYEAAKIPTAAVMQVTKATTRTDGEISEITYNVAYNNAAGTTVNVIKSYTMEQYKVWETAYTAAQMASSSYEAAGRFSLFNGVPATVYAIRVYDGLLTADEKVQNRFADLLYYHQVDIPENFAQNKEALLKAAKSVNITISADPLQTAANKLLLEDAIGSVAKTVTITVNGETLESSVVLTNGAYELPTVIGEKKVIAWQTASGNMKPGESINITEDVTISPYLVDSPKTSTSISLKASSVASELAMRFTATIARKDFDAIVEVYGRENIRVGMLVTPAKYVELADGVFTREALRAMVDFYSGVHNAPAYINIVSYGGFYATDENYMTVAGSIYNFSEATRQYNPEFAAVAFVDIYIDDDLEPDFTLYGDYNPAANHRVKDAFSAARPYMTSTQQKWIDSLISSFGA